MEKRGVSPYQIFLLALGVLFLIVPMNSADAQCNYYVDQEFGDDGNDGLSWGNAKATIGAALTLISSACTVHVAEGYYYERLTLDIDGIVLLGGYPNGGGTRNPAIYETGIDGSSGGTTLTISSASNVEVDGFTIRAGAAATGAGLLCTSGVSAVINDCIIEENAATTSGGGAAFQDSTATFTNNEVLNNTCSGTSGGAGIILLNSTVTMTDNVISGNINTASNAYGGGIYADATSELPMTNNTISNNTAYSTGGHGTYAEGGGLYTVCETTLINNTFTGNWVYSYSSANYNGTKQKYAFGGAIFCSSGSDVLLSGNMINNNTAYADNRNNSQQRYTYGYGYGGGVYCDDGSVTDFNNDHLEGNLAYAYGQDTAYNGRGYGYAYGGAIACKSNSVVSIGLGVEVVSNHAYAVGAGYSSYDYAYAYGGGIAAWGAGSDIDIDGVYVRFNKITASPNNASCGEGIYILDAPANIYNSIIVENYGEGVYLQDSNTVMMNDTISYNGGIGIRGYGGTPTIRNCILWGNADDLYDVTATYSNIQDADPGEGNLNPPCDPLFIGDGDYHIYPNSCCVDRGTSDLIWDHDFDGESRPYNFGIPDIGADETTNLNPTPTVYITPAGTYTPVPTPANDFYVNGQTGDDSNNGLSWGTAKASISAAVEMAAAAGNGNIHVATATYVENLVLGNNMVLLGGYSQSGLERNPDVYLTIIDGSALLPVIRISEVSNVVVDGFNVKNGRGDYGGGIHVSRSQNVTINNNWITENTAYGSPVLPNLALGGGIYISGADIQVTDNDIDYNLATGSTSYGAGLYCGAGYSHYIGGNTIGHNTSSFAGGGAAFGNPDSTVMFENNVVEFNLCSSVNAIGGGILVGSMSTVYMIGNVISDNTIQSINSTNKTVRGGAVYCSGNLTMVNGVIERNLAYNYFNGGYGATLTECSYGGALYCADGGIVHSIGNIYNENLAHAEGRNSSQGYYGQGFAYGGAVFCEGGGDVTLSGDTLSANTCYAYGVNTAYNGRGSGYAYGGGVHCADLSTVNINLKSIVEDNRCQAAGAGYSSYDYAYSRGGGIAVYGPDCDVDIDSAVIRGNNITASPATQLRGYGLYISDVSVDIYNSIIAEHPDTAVYLYSSNSMIINDTIVYNDGYGIYGTEGSAPVIRNCILWGNLDDLEGVSATYSNIQGKDPGEGNLSPPCDPLFVGGGDYHLQPQSCCVDRGSYDDIRDHDFDDDPRPYAGGIPDLGADEVDVINPSPTAYATPAVTPTPEPTPSDHYYVDGLYGDDLNDGLSWGTAKASITAAIELAEAAGGAYVHVTGHVYVENLVCTDNLYLWGGYPPGGGIRNPDVYPSVVDGDAYDPVMTVSEVKNVEIDGFMVTNGVGDYGAGITVSRSENVNITNNKIQENVTYGSPGARNLACGGGLYLEGVNIFVGDNLIENNIAEGDAAYGAGIYCGGGYKIVISGNEILANTSGHAGGGVSVHAADSTVHLEDNTIENNLCYGGSTSNRGGGLYVHSAGSCYAEGNSISNNTIQILNAQGRTTRGGGIYCDGELTLQSNTISDNLAYTYYSGGYGSTLTEYAYGGALYCADGCTVKSWGNVYENNKAHADARNTSQGYYGQGIAYGGTVFCDAGCDLEMKGDIIRSSTAQAYGQNTSYNGRGRGYAYGGGIYITDETVAFIGGSTRIEGSLCTASGAGYGSYDYAYARGGGVYINGGLNDVEFDGALIKNNNLSASPNNASTGYGLYIQESSARVYNTFVVENAGTGIYLYGGTPEFVNDTIAYNPGYGIRGTEGAVPTIRNCILWGNNDDLEAVTATYSNIQGGDPGQGNLTPPCNPEFVGIDDYHILPSSCCVDRGLNTLAPLTDYDGDTRPYNGLIVDIGADETQSINPTPQPSVTPNTPTPVGTYTATPAANFYVDKVNGNDSNNGLSWATAKASINGALSIAGPDSFIHVARAVYHENIEIGSDTTVLGGYPIGGGERDPHANITLIDGGYRNSVVMIQGAADVIFDGFTVRHGEENAGAGLFVYDCEHVIVRNCVFETNIGGESGNYVRGGGAYFGRCYAFWVHDCSFMYNSVVGTEAGYGGGLFIETSALGAVEDNLFLENTSSFVGGGLACIDVDDTVIISGNAFSGNMASNAFTSSIVYGGGLFCSDTASPQILNNEFDGNWAYSTGRNSSGRGGAICMNGDSQVYGNTFTANQARCYISQNYGGHIYGYSYGGAVYIGLEGAPDIDANYFTGNWAYSYVSNSNQGRYSYGYSYGAALFCNSTAETMTISHCIIKENTSYAYGHNTAYNGRGYGYGYAGGIFINTDAKVEVIENTLIYDNVAKGQGSGYSSYDYGYGYGAGIYINDDVSSVTLDRLNIDGNDSTAIPNNWSGGDGIYSYSDDTVILTNSFITNNGGHGIYWHTGGPNVDIVNNTIVSNGNYGIYKNAGSLNIINCIVWDHSDDIEGVSATYSDIQDGDAGIGNISADPLFVGQGDYHIQMLSPCIDFGSNVAEPSTTLYDYDGNDRFFFYDIGADEYAGPPTFNLTAYLDGFYLVGSQRPTTIDIEFRFGTTPETADTVVASYEDIPLNANGQTGNIDLTGCPGGDLFLTVSHLNHLKVITENMVNVNYGTTANINLSDEDDLTFEPCYGIDPLGDEVDGMISLRGGNANGDAYVNASIDFIIWLLANGSTPGSGNWDERADFNGDSAVNSADYSEWLNQNGRVSFAPGFPAKDMASEKTDSGEFELKVRETGVADWPYIEVDVIYNAESPDTLIAVDAAIAYDPAFLGKPQMTADFLTKGMTDFSKGLGAPDLPDVYHYSKGALPGQTGIKVPAGANILYRLRFPLRTSVGFSGPEYESKLDLVPGFYGVALDKTLLLEMNKGASKQTAAEIRGTEQKITGTSN